MKRKALKAPKPRVVRVPSLLRAVRQVGASLDEMREKSTVIAQWRELIRDTREQLFELEHRVTHLEQGDPNDRDRAAHAEIAGLNKALAREQERGNRILLLNDKLYAANNELRRQKREQRLARRKGKR